ncbi:hypothetical protein BLOT_015635 [Blomia tropicalis]|nr:hypothetical protein BLOT_015635 [Blomia tropicalis]
MNRYSIDNVRHRNMTFTLVFIKPLSTLQQKDAQASHNKIFTGKIQTKEIDLHEMSDYVLKNNDPDSSEDECKERITKKTQLNSGDDGLDTVAENMEDDNNSNNKNQNIDELLKSLDENDDPNFDLYCSAKFSINEDSLNDIFKDNLSIEQQMETDIDERFVVFNNEIINSGRKCTISLDTESRLLQALSQTLQMKYELENVFFKNEYMIKFNVSISFGSYFSIQKFEQLIEQLFQMMIIKESRKLIIEIPFDVINYLEKILIDKNQLHNYCQVKILSLSIGSLINLSRFFSHYSLRSSNKPTMSTNWMQLELKIAEKYLIIYFYIETKKKIFKLIYNFSSIKQIVLEKYRTQYRLYLDFINAPLMFYSDVDERHHKLLLGKNSCDNFFWRRTTFQSVSGHIPRRASEQQYGQANNQLEDCFLVMAKSYCLEIGEKDHFIEKLINAACLCKHLNKNFNFYLANIFQTKSSIDYTMVKSLLNRKQLPFSIHYACLVLFSSSYKIIDTLKNENSFHTFLDTIKRESENDFHSLEQCLYYLKIQCKEMSIVNVYNELMKLLTNHDRLKKSPINMEHVLIRRAILTPTHLELMQPIPLLKSRFSMTADLDFAIRLTILDDNNRRLNNCKHITDSEFIRNILIPQLSNGLQIGDRKFEFLGSSSSQMRENGVIFYAKDRQDRHAYNIRNLAGDLSALKRNVAKYVARFGLMFSQALTIIPTDEQEMSIYITKDFLGEVKPAFENFSNSKKEQHIFSDGVGIIANSLVPDIVQHLSQLRNSDYIPSAFQIRYGGCKGMLVAYDTTPQRAIIFRNSMRKYNSSDTALGILKYSMPRPVFLNRPLINILDQLDINRDEFYIHFERSTSSVAKALLFDSCALELIKTYANLYLPYDMILQSGISLLNEPFLRSIINYLIYYRLNELKSKARIRIPFSNGRMAFGVIDETMQLEYGEIFFQYTKMSPDGTITNETETLEGEVMVTKFPCLQPGDVRKLRATKVDKLSHIKDCIVFPSKGKRPHPDEMGGSDLDGDEYAIFWNTELVFPGKNSDSMTFPYGMTKPQEHDLTIRDIVEFYCNYLLLSNIGQVANSHLIFSDYHPQGIFSKECHDLAVKYSISLDYQKTGIIQEFPRKYNLSIRPDFMERYHNDKVYLSKRILGQYFRHCTLIERIVDLSQFDSESSSNNSNQLLNKSPIFILPNWRKFYDSAEETFMEYKLRIVEIMDQLDIENETILFSEVYEDKSDTSKTLVSGLFTYFRNKFYSQYNELECSDDRQLLISSWYAICYEKCFTYNGKILIGLPWIISEKLCQLADANLNENVTNDIDCGNQILIDCETSNEQAKLHSKQYFWKLETIWKAFNIENDPIQMMACQQIIADQQIAVTMELIIRWIYSIKNEIYLDQDEGTELIVIFDGKSKIFLTEQELLKKYIMQKLDEINLECKMKQEQHVLPTITTLFNQFMILNVDLKKAEEKFVQKLFFLTGLDNLQFMCDDNSTNVDNSSVSLPNFGGKNGVEQSNKQFQSIPNTYRSNALPSSSVSPSTTIYKYPSCKRSEMSTTMNTVTSSYESNTTTMSTNNSNGGSKNSSSSINGSSPEPKRFQSRQFHQSNRYVSNHKVSNVTDDELTSVERNHNEQYEVMTKGFEHSITILRLMFGHPDFFEKIFNKFDIITLSAYNKNGQGCH